MTDKEDKSRQQSEEDEKILYWLEHQKQEHLYFKIDQLQQILSDLRKAMMLDEVTGLGNRPYFEKRFIEELRRAKRHDNALSLLILDAIDDKKERKERLPTFNVIIDVVARCLHESLREYDICCRTGKSEFRVILPEAQSKACPGIIRRVRKKINDVGIQCDFSIGNATWPLDGEDLDQLVEKAFTSMHADLQQQGLEPVQTIEIETKPQKQHKADYPRASVKFEGFPQAIRLEAIQSDKGYFLRLPLNFLRMGSTATLDLNDGLLHTSKIIDLDLELRRTKSPCLLLSVHTLFSERLG